MLRLSRGEKAVQPKKLPVVETTKMPKIQNFQNFKAISRKKANISKTVGVGKNYFFEAYI